MYRVLAVGGLPARPTVTQVLLDEAPDFRVSMVETAASALVVAADETFDVGVIDTDVNGAEAMVTAIGEAHPLLPLVVVTDAECGPPALFDAGAQDHLCRTDLTAAMLVRACRHAIVRQAAVLRLQARAAPDRGGDAGLPEILLASTSGAPPERLLSMASRLLDSEALSAVTIERLRTEAQLDEKTLRRAKRPLGNVFLKLVTRDLAAEAELVASCFQGAGGTAGSLAEAVHFAVRTLAGFWRQAPTSITLASDYTGLDERLRDLRADHLMRLSDSVAGLLADHRDEVAHDDADRAITVAVDQLLAVLDHQRLLGALHPSTASPDEVIAEFAGQVTVFLAGPPSAAPATPTPEPIAIPTPQPAPEPIAAPAPERRPIATPAPQPAPEPIVAASPEPVTEPQPAPEPIVAATPEPVAEPQPAPEPIVAATPEPVAEPQPAPVTPPHDEEARVAAALARLSAVRSADADRAPDRPRPTEDPFVTAATGPPRSQPEPEPPALEPEPEPPAVPTASPPAAKTSLFARSAPTSSTGAPTFDMARIVVEGSAVAPRPSRSTRSPGGAERPDDAPRPETSVGTPTFDMDRIVVNRVRASVA